jgi:hypothetical protein
MHPEWGFLEPHQIKTWLAHFKQSLAVELLEVGHFLVDSLQNLAAFGVVKDCEFEGHAVVVGASEEVHCHCFHRACQFVEARFLGDFDSGVAGEVSSSLSQLLSLPYEEPLNLFSGHVSSELVIPSW